MTSSEEEIGTTESTDEDEVIGIGACTSGTGTVGLAEDGPISSSISVSGTLADWQNRHLRIPLPFEYDY